MKLGAVAVIAVIAVIGAACDSTVVDPSSSPPVTSSLVSDPSSPPPSPSKTGGSGSPLPAFVQAGKVWQAAVLRYFSKGGGGTAAHSLRQGHRMMAEIERTYARWWRLASPVADKSSPGLRTQVRAYAALAARWNQLEETLLDKLESCGQVVTPTCAAELALLLRRHTHLTKELQKRAIVITTFNLEHYAG